MIFLYCLYLFSPSPYEMFSFSSRPVSSVSYSTGRYTYQGRSQPIDLQAQTYKCWFDHSTACDKLCVVGGGGGGELKGLRAQSVVEVSAY